MSKQPTPITPTLLLDASRLPNSSEVEIERTLYSVCKRSTSKTIYGRHWHETTLYADEDCTQLVCKLHRHNQRIMKSGKYRLTDTFKNFKQYVNIVCIDNGVRRTETNKIKYDYHYE
jgi:hypothetical protein